MKEVINKIFLLFIVFVCFDSLASTIGIATGNKTIDGRPLLFKNKDRVDNYPSDVNYYDGIETYFSYVFQQNDGQDHTRARMGINSVGFGIVYSDSENLEGASTGPYGSQLTALALKTCVTIEDFRNLLNDTNGARRAHNHFAVIDSTGKGSMFEVDGFSYIEIPVIDSIGTMANTAKYHPSRGTPASGSTSPQREARALYLLSHGSEEGLDYKYFTNEIIKDFSETQEDENKMPVGQYLTNPVLSRYKTVVGGVIKGILNGDNPTIGNNMWLCLSEPSLTIALPFFGNVNYVPAFIRSSATGEGMAGSSDKVRQLVYDYSSGRYSDRYIDTQVLMEIRDYNYKIQDSLFNSYEQNTILWKEQSNDQVEESIKLWMNEIHLWAKSKYDSLLIILDVDQDNPSSKKSFGIQQNYPNPFNPSTTIKYSLSASRQEFQTPTHVLLKVYDILGKEVTTLVSENKRPGDYEIVFDASNLTSGVYFYQLRSSSYTESKKMILLK